MSIEQSKSLVCEFYEGKNIFLTGGTGYLGVTIIEKILRSLPNIGTIFLLMRQKKKKTIEQRLDDLKKGSVFERLISENKIDVFKKLFAVEGDVSEPNLGLSSESRSLLINKVDIVIHSAATLDFQESLKPTVIINLLGTRRVMDLCKDIRNLKAMVHISSAYVNSYMLDVDEKLYEAPENAQKIIDLVDSLNDAALKELEPKLLKDHPNTYTFTKHLAEHEVNKCASLFPCGIVRPSIITAAWREPVPGWTISKNGPQGFFMGALKGVIRRLPVDSSLIYDYIPVDVVSNQILVTAYHVNHIMNSSPEKPLELSIFHCTSSTYRPFRWAAIKDKINVNMQKYPLKSEVWYPHLKLIDSLILFRISAIFLHFLPAIFLDALTKAFGGRPILLRLHTNVWKSLNLLKRFIFTEWKFYNKNTIALIKTLNDTDKALFHFDMCEMHWDNYFEMTVLGVRTYLYKEPQSTIPAAKKKNRVLYILHLFLQISIYIGIWSTIATVLNTTMAKTGITGLIPGVLVRVKNL